MPTLLKILLAPLLSLLLAGTALAAPDEVSATYGWLRNGQEVGLSTENFARTGSHYYIESSTEAVGIFAYFAKGRISVTSEGVVGKDGLRPEKMTYKRGEDPNRAYAADFDYKADRIMLHHDGKMEEEVLPPGLQDRLSLMYQFMFLPRPMPAKLELDMTDGRRIVHYTYALLGPETIKTPIGPLKTLRYRRQEEGDKDKIVDLWLAVEKGYFPVRMVAKEADGTEEQVITSLSLRGK